MGSLMSMGIPCRDNLSKNADSDNRLDTILYPGGISGKARLRPEVAAPLGTLREDSPMTCSPARLLANRANAARSKGPTTPEGKARSRGNAVKHGLSGAGIALPTEDLAEVERRFSAMERELKPEGELASYLVRRVAGLSVRVERCMMHESRMTAGRIRRALDDHDEDRALDVETAFASLPADPAGSVRELLRTPEGVDRMIGAWLGIKDDLGRERMTKRPQTHLQLAENLLGRRPGDLPISRACALGEALSLSFRFLGEGDGAGLDEMARRGWAKKQMIELIDGEVGALRALLETFDLEEIALDRAESVDRALFDPSKEGVLARRYEAAAERALYKALDQLKEAQPDQVPDPAEPADLPPAPEFAAEDPSGVTDSEEVTPRVGSFGKSSVAPPKSTARRERPMVGAVPAGLEPAT